MRGYSSYDAGGTPGTCLVIGGSGRVGSRVVVQLVDRGRPVRVLVRPDSSIRRLAPVLSRVRLVAGDVRNPDTLAEAVRGVHQVIWAAGIPPERSGRSEEIDRVEVEGVQHLIDACKRESVAYITYLSCMYASPNARSALFRAKWRAEESIRQSGISHSILRSSVIIHPGRRFYFQIPPIAWWEKAPGIPHVLPSFRTSPIASDDVAGCLIDASLNPRVRGRTVDIGGPETLSPSDWIRLAGEERGKPFKEWAIPPALAEAGLWLGSRLFPGRMLSWEVFRDMVGQDAVVDPATMKELFPHVALTPVRDLIRRMKEQNADL